MCMLMYGCNKCTSKLIAEHGQNQFSFKRFAIEGWKYCSKVS